MGLNNEERKIIVELELEKSARTLEQVDYLIQGKLWETLANRLYYGAYHAVCALLIHNGIQVGTHKGAVVMFNKEFVKTGKITEEEGRVYSQLQSLRERGDYNCYINTNESEIMPYVAATRAFVSKIRELIA